MQIYRTLLMPLSDLIIISRAQVEKLQLELLKEMYFFFFKFVVKMLKILPNSDHPALLLETYNSVW